MKPFSAAPCSLLGATVLAALAGTAIVAPPAAEAATVNASVSFIGLGPNNSLGVQQARATNSVALGTGPLGIPNELRRRAFDYTAEGFVTVNAADASIRLFNRGGAIVGSGFNVGETTSGDFFARGTLMGPVGAGPIDVRLVNFTSAFVSSDVRNAVPSEPLFGGEASGTVNFRFAVDVFDPITMRFPRTIDTSGSYTSGTRFFFENGLPRQEALPIQAVVNGPSQFQIDAIPGVLNAQSFARVLQTTLAVGTIIDLRLPAGATIGVGGRLSATTRGVNAHAAFIDAQNSALSQLILPAGWSFVPDDPDSTIFSQQTDVLSLVLAMGAEPVAPIPLPATGWMLLAGLSALRGLCRRS